MSKRTGLTDYISGNLTPALLRCQPRFLENSPPLARLGRGALQTGTAAMFFSCASLITALAAPRTNLYFTFVLTLGTIYSVVSFPASLYFRRPHDAHYVLSLLVNHGHYIVWCYALGGHTTRGTILRGMFFIPFLILHAQF